MTTAVRDVAALYGLGGVGKTQLAVEYSHRYSSEYSLIWWINAENSELIAQQLASLAVQLGIPISGRTPEDAASALGSLGRLENWLLIFDNAETAGDIRQWIPVGSGHVLITSRSPMWGQIADRVEVDVLERRETVSLLRRRINSISEATAVGLAEALGDLPLAVEQAAAYIEASAITPEHYLLQFGRRRGKMLESGVDLVYSGTVDTCWTLALDQLRASSPATVQLLELAAFCGPDPIPLALFQHSRRSTGSLRDAITSGDLDEVVAAARRYSLIRRDGKFIQLHRLVQAVIRSHLSVEIAAARARVVVDLCHDFLGKEPEHPQTWGAWEALASHLLSAPAFHPDSDFTLWDEGPAGRSLLIDAGVYFGSRGDYPAARSVDFTIHQRWSEILGPEHQLTLLAGSNLAADLADIGESQAAVLLGESVLVKQRAMLGASHADTLHSMHSQAVWLTDVGEYRSALKIAEQAYLGRTQVLGPDHPDTLASANSLATRIGGIGDFTHARELASDTLDKRRSILGSDHPDTLRSTHSLAIWLWELGEFEDARQLAETTLANRSRLLGENHPATLASASNFALVQASLGELASARLTCEDTLRRRVGVLGENHPHTLVSACNLAALIAQQGQLDEALGICRQSLAARIRILGPNHPHTLASANNLGVILAITGDLTRAQEILNETTQQRREFLGEDHPQSLSSRLNLAELLLRMGDHDEAERIAQEEHDRRVRVLGPDHPDTHRTLRFVEGLPGSGTGFTFAFTPTEDTFSRRRRVAESSSRSRLAIGERTRSKQTSESRAKNEEAMRIAAVQMTCRVGEVASNVAQMVQHIRLAAERGCDVVVLPEMCDTGYLMTSIIETASAWDDGPMVELRAAAAECGTHVITGLSERVHDVVYNSVVSIDHHGSVNNSYRKTHLATQVPILEQNYLGRGQELTVGPVYGMMSGLMVCYDIRFPEVSRALMLAGADTFFLPAAFPLARISHWNALLRARAIENQVFIVAANRVGIDGPGLTFGGCSQIIDPDGTILASASEVEETVLMADIALDKLGAVRRNVMIREDRLPTLYASPVRVVSP